MNSRLRAPGISAYEFFTQRDQTSGVQLSLNDLQLINDQQKRRAANHKASERCKSNKPPHPTAEVNVGDIVYRYDDGSKLAARPRYIILSIEKGWCKVKRFTEKRVGSNTYTLKLTECYAVPDDYSNLELPPYPVHEEIVVVYLGKPTEHQTEETEADKDDSEDDVEVEVEYPCSSCKREVKEEQEALSCDACESWCHIRCGDVTQERYQQLLESA